MKSELEDALEFFVKESQEPATLGGKLRASDKLAESALTKLLSQRQALVEGDRWQAAVPIVAIVLFAVVGVVAAMASKLGGVVGVAVAAATAAMFRLLQLGEERKARAMVFALIQAAAKDGKYPPVALVKLLLEASRSRTTKAGKGKQPVSVEQA